MPPSANRSAAGSGWAEAAAEEAFAEEAAVGSRRGCRTTRPHQLGVGVVTRPRWFVDKKREEFFSFLPLCYQISFLSVFSSLTSTRGWKTPRPGRQKARRTCVQGRRWHRCSATTRLDGSTEGSCPRTGSTAKARMRAHSRLSVEPRLLLRGSWRATWEDRASVLVRSWPSVLALPTAGAYRGASTSTTG